MEKLSTYNIAFKGLKEGNHLFDYHIRNSFFELFENSLIEEAEADVTISLEKRNTFMSLHLDLKGSARLTCDRCLDQYDQEIANKADLIIKFGDYGYEDSDEVIWLHPEDYQFNVAQIIYDYIVLGIPLKHIHPDRQDGSSECNPEMLEKLKEYSPLHEGKGDQRWIQLKNLLNNN